MTLLLGGEYENKNLVKAGSLALVRSGIEKSRPTTHANQCFKGKARTSCASCRIHVFAYFLLICFD